MRKTAGKNELVVNKMELQVFILTSGRVRRQKTIESLNCTSLWYKSVDLRIVIPRNEKTMWERVNPQWVAYLYCVNEKWRVEEIRQHILQKFRKNLHLVLDDDLTLYKKLEARRLEKIKDSIAFLKHIRELLETYKHGSIASHTSHHFRDPSLCLNERAGGVHFYHRNILLKNKINYSVCLEHEDLHVSLSLIKNGIPNVISYYYVFAQKTNASGGCSKYRTLQTQNRYAKALVDFHQPFVRLRKKYSKLWRGEKFCTIVSWKKAFAASGEAAYSDSSSSEEEDTKVRLHKVSLAKKAKFKANLELDGTWCVDAAGTFTWTPARDAAGNSIFLKPAKRTETPTKRVESPAKKAKMCRDDTMSKATTTATVMPYSKGIELRADKVEISLSKKRKLNEEKEKSLPESRKMKIIGKERSFEKKEIKNRKNTHEIVRTEMQVTSKFAGNFLRENEAIRRSVSLRMQIFYLNLLNIYEQQHLKIVQKFGGGKLVGQTVQIYFKPKRFFWTTKCASYDSARDQYTFHKCPMAAPVKVVHIALKDIYLLKWATA